MLLEQALARIAPLGCMGAASKPLTLHAGALCVLVNCMYVYMMNVCMSSCVSVRSSATLSLHSSCGPVRCCLRDSCCFVRVALSVAVSLSVLCVAQSIGLPFGLFACIGPHTAVTAQLGTLVQRGRRPLRPRRPSVRLGSTRLQGRAPVPRVPRAVMGRPRACFGRRAMALAMRDTCAPVALPTPRPSTGSALLGGGVVQGQRRARSVRWEDLALCQVRHNVPLHRCWRTAPMCRLSPLACSHCSCCPLPSQA